MRRSSSAGAVVVEPIGSAIPERGGDVNWLFWPSRGRRKTCSPAPSTLWLWCSASTRGTEGGQRGLPASPSRVVLREAVRWAPAGQGS
jgi:hypothetical protein